MQQRNIILFCVQLELEKWLKKQLLLKGFSMLYKNPQVG
jgi:hypothetical protein